MRKVSKEVGDSPLLLFSFDLADLVRNYVQTR